MTTAQVPTTTSDPVLDEIVRRLVATYQPRAIWLFGSRARGTAQPDSDYDLCVVVDESAENPWKRPVAGIHALSGMGISKDLLVHTRSEFERFIDHPSSLTYEITHEGRCLYAAA